MKTVITRYGNWRRLLIDDPTIAPGLKKSKSFRDDERLCVAELTCYFESPCYRVTDVRLMQHGSIHKYLSLSAEAVWAHWSPKDQDESDFVKSQLREYVEDPDGTINWATFSGFRRGQKTIGGYDLDAGRFNEAGYVSFSDGMKQLREIQEFWTSFDGDLASASRFKLPNPDLQPGESHVMSLVVMRRMEAERAGATQDRPRERG